MYYELISNYKVSSGMVILFFLLFSLYAVLACAQALIFTQFLRLPLLNPFTIVAAIYFPIELAKVSIGPMVLLDHGVTDPYFIFSLFITDLYLLFSAIALILFFLFLKSKTGGGMEGIPFSFRISAERLVRVEFFFLGLAVLTYVLMAELGSSVYEWFSNPRHAYQYYRVGVGSIYTFSLSCISVAFATGLPISKSKPSLLLRVIFYFVFVCFFGSKLFLVNMLVYLLVFVWFFYRRFFWHILLPSSFTVVCLLFYNLYLSYGSIDYRKVAGYFDYYYNSSRYFKAYFEGRLMLYYGYLSLTDLWRFVPRILYPGKPFVYGVLHLNEFFYPGMAAKTHTPGFGGPIMAFADYSVFGVIVSAFLDFKLYFKGLIAMALFGQLRPAKASFERSDLFLFYLLLFAPNLFWRIPILYSAPMVVILICIVYVMAGNRCLGE